MRAVKPGSQDDLPHIKAPLSSLHLALALHVGAVPEKRGIVYRRFVEQRTVERAVRNIRRAFKRSKGCSDELLDVNNAFRINPRHRQKAAQKAFLVYAA